MGGKKKEIPTSSRKLRIPSPPKIQGGYRRTELSVEREVSHRPTTRSTTRPVEREASQSPTTKSTRSCKKHDEAPSPRTLRSSSANLKTGIRTLEVGLERSKKISPTRKLNFSTRTPDRNHRVQTRQQSSPLMSSTPYENASCLKSASQSPIRRDNSAIRPLPTVEESPIKISRKRTNCRRNISHSLSDDQSGEQSLSACLESEPKPSGTPGKETKRLKIDLMRKDKSMPVHKAAMQQSTSGSTRDTTTLRSHSSSGRQKSASVTPSKKSTPIKNVRATLVNFQCKPVVKYRRNSRKSITSLNESDTNNETSVSTTSEVSGKVTNDRSLQAIERQGIMLVRPWDASEPEDTIEPNKNKQSHSRALEVANAPKDLANGPVSSPRITESEGMEVINQNWVMITIHSPSMGEELKKMNELPVVDRQNFVNLFLSTINNSLSFSKLPAKIRSENLEPFACRVNEVNSYLNLEPCLKVTMIPFDKPSEQNKDGWKVVLKGVMAECLAFTIIAGNTILIYGGRIDKKNRLVFIEKESSPKDIYVFDYNCKGQIRPPQSTYAKDVFTEYCYGNEPETTRINQTAVIINPRKMSILGFGVEEADLVKDSNHVKGLTTVNGGSDQLNRRRVVSLNGGGTNQLHNGLMNVDNNEINIELPHQGTSCPGTSATVAGTITSTKKKNEDVDGSFKKPGASKRQIQQPIADEEVVVDVDDNEIDSMSYSELFARQLCVPANQRRKISKFRGETYLYKTLKALDDDLRKQIKQDLKASGRAEMLLPSECFLYGYVIDDNGLPPQRNTYPKSYDVRISDETKENVSVRICTSKFDAQVVGPQIEVGQVLRIHRATVQVEFDKVLQEHAMVVSTALHRNYTVFNFDGNSKRIIYNSAAKNITLTTDDEERVFNLFKFFRNRNLDPRSQDQSSDTGVNVADVSEILFIQGESPESTTNPVLDKNDKGADDGTNFHDSQREMIQDSRSPTPVRAKRRRRSGGSLYFHRSPPPSPI